MKQICQVFCIVLFLTVSLAWGQSSNWRSKVAEIQLLVDDYDALIRKLGPPAGNEDRDYGEYFELPDSKIYALFEPGECVESSAIDGEMFGWKVPEWTVIQIRVNLKNPIKLSSLKFNLKDFKKSRIDDVPEFEYENEKTGVYFTLWRDGKVRSITYSPPSNLWDKRC